MPITFSVALDAVRDAWLAQLVDTRVFKLEMFTEHGALADENDKTRGVATIEAAQGDDGVDIVLHADTADALLAHLNQALAEPMADLPKAVVERSVANAMRSGIGSRVLLAL